MSAMGDTHAHRADASGTHFTSLKPRAALQAPFWGSGEVMQSQRALGALSRPQLPKHAFRMVPERLPRSPQHPSCTTRPLVRTLATQNIRSPCIESAPPLTSHTHIHAGRLVVQKRRQDGHNSALARRKMGLGHLLVVGEGCNVVYQRNKNTRKQSLRVRGAARSRAPRSLTTRQCGSGDRCPPPYPSPGTRASPPRAVEAYERRRHTHWDTRGEDRPQQPSRAPLAISIWSQIKSLSKARTARRVFWPGRRVRATLGRAPPTS